MLRQIHSPWCQRSVVKSPAARRKWARSVSFRSNRKSPIRSGNRACADGSWDFSHSLRSLWPQRDRTARSPMALRNGPANRRPDGAGGDTGKSSGAYPPPGDARCGDRSPDRNCRGHRFIAGPERISFRESTLPIFSVTAALPFYSPRQPLWRCSFPRVAPVWSIPWRPCAPNE